MPSQGILYIVATPIGNLSDLSERCRSVLRAVSLVVAEDTRRTRPLLQQVESCADLESLHQHSEAQKVEKLIGELRGGRDIAVVSDAGTPGVSDPGSLLTARAHAEGIKVVPIPGPSAVTTAVSASGFGGDRYTFFGFVPRKGRDRREVLQYVAESKWPTVLFESPHRLTEALASLGEVLEQGRRVMVARELSKVFEELKIGTPEELAVYYRQEPVRGEVTLVVEGGTAPEVAVDEEVVKKRARELLSEGLSRKDAVKAIVSEMSLPKNDVYRIVASE